MGTEMGEKELAKRAAGTCESYMDHCGEGVANVNSGLRRLGLICMIY